MFDLGKDEEERVSSEPEERRTSFGMRMLGNGEEDASSCR